MTDPAIIEAAARALLETTCRHYGDPYIPEKADLSLTRILAQAALAAVTPLIEAAATPRIEAAALEKAAKVAEKHTNWPATVPETWAREEIAAAIRALIPKE